MNSFPFSFAKRPREAQRRLLRGRLTVIAITAKELLRILARDGWNESRQSGSHLILRHDTKPGRIVVPIHTGKTLKVGTLANILRSAGLTEDDVRRLR